MPDKRVLRLSEYGISNKRYLELKAFCLQYGEKQEDLKGTLSMSSAALTGLPHGTAISDQTGLLGTRRAALSADLELIERTCRDAAPGYWQHLLANVTEGVSWEYLNPPCGRRQFYEQRRKFFYLLNMRKG